MKLDCEVVKDLYVLYKENELSAQVKAAVEEHLNQCEQCKKTYESESDFTDIIKQQVEEPPKKMDEKMFSRLKLLRLRIAIVLIVVISISIFGSSYYKSREYLRRDSLKYRNDICGIFGLLQTIKDEKAYINNEGMFNGNIDNIIDKSNEDYEIFKRSLNFIEKRNLRDYNKRSSFELSVKSLLFTLNSRSKNGTWSKDDEKAYSILYGELDNIQKNIRIEDNKLGNMFFTVKSSNIERSLNKINQLAFSYIRYNKFPEELKKLSKEDMKKRLEFLFNQKGEKFFFDERGDVECSFNMIIATGYEGYNGIIDKYTGKVIELYNGSWKNAGELISIEKVKGDMTAFLRRDFGGEVNFAIKDLGINHNITANDGAKFYCFQVQLMYKGYKIGKSFNVTCDARTGRIALDGTYDMVAGTNLDLKLENLDIKAKYSYEAALKNIGFLGVNMGEYKYNDMFFMKSRLTGKYELVYEYKAKDSYGNESYLYINAVTGKRDYQSFGYNQFSY